MLSFKRLMFELEGCLDEGQSLEFTTPGSAIYTFDAETNEGIGFQHTTREYGTDSAQGIHLLRPDWPELEDAIAVAIRDGFKTIWIYGLPVSDKGGSRE